MGRGAVPGGYAPIRATAVPSNANVFPGGITMRSNREREQAVSSEGTRPPSPRTSAEADDPALAWERHRPTVEEEDRNGRIRGFQRQGGSWAPSNSHRGSAASWACVALATAGFTLGGLAVAMGGSLLLLIVGGALMLAAFVVAVACDILSDVVLDPPRTESEEPHQTPLHRIKRTQRA
ncbi:hypothetical protein GCM10027590_43050 [Nocardiopsis nanhaiensis]